MLALAPRARAKAADEALRPAGSSNSSSSSNSFSSESASAGTLADDEALAALRREPGCDLARMSGSGATVFGLFANRSQAAGAARRLGIGHPGWWVTPALLR